MTEQDPETEDLQKPRPLPLKVRDGLVSLRLPLLILGHLIAFMLIYWVAFLMRFTLEIPSRYAAVYWQGLPYIAVLKLVVFHSLGSFHGWWRHVNFSDFISLIRSAVAALVVILAFDYFVFQNWSIQIPRIVLVNDLVLTIVVLGGLIVLASVGRANRAA